MKTVSQFPRIALLFGVVALVTAVTLIADAAVWINWVLAIFWTITGFLGLYQGLKN